MKNTQRGFVVPLLLTIIALLIIGGGIYLYTQKNQPPTVVLNEMATTTAQTGNSAPAQTNTPVSSISVPEMLQYTDSQFGFSFWYPNDLVVKDTSNQLSNNGFIFYHSDAQVIGQLQVDNVQIEEIHSPSTAIRVAADHGSPWGGGGEVTYYFDKNLHTWMAAWTYSGPNGNSSATTTADVSQNTMGGLHMLPISDFEESYLIPLSATNFVYISDITGSGEATPLANTILALDPAVATPVSSAQQQVTIQNSAQAFVLSRAPLPSITYTTYTNQNLGFSLAYPTNFAPTNTLTNKQIHEVSSYMGACPWQSKSATAFCYVGDNYPNGFATAAVIVDASSTQPEADCTYVHGGQIRYEGDTGKPPTPVVINGVTFYKDVSGDAGLGHYLGSDEYSTYHNNICYSITVNTEGYATEDGSVGDTTVIQNYLNGILNSFVFTR